MAVDYWRVFGDKTWYQRTDWGLSHEIWWEMHHVAGRLMDLEWELEQLDEKLNELQSVTKELREVTQPADDIEALADQFCLETGGLFGLSRTAGGGWCMLLPTTSGFTVMPGSFKDTAREVIQYALIFPLRIHNQEEERSR
jgi:hypothetical protein